MALDSRDYMKYMFPHFQCFRSMNMNNIWPAVYQDQDLELVRDLIRNNLFITISSITFNFARVSEISWKLKSFTVCASVGHQSFVCFKTERITVDLFPLGSRPASRTDKRPLSSYRTPPEAFVASPTFIPSLATRSAKPVNVVSPVGGGVWPPPVQFPQRQATTPDPGKLRVYLSLCTEGGQRMPR